MTDSSGSRDAPRRMQPTTCCLKLYHVVVEAATAHQLACSGGRYPPSGAATGGGKAGEMDTAMARSRHPAMVRSRAI